MDATAWRLIAPFLFVLACNGRSRVATAAAVSGVPGSASARPTAVPGTTGPLPAPGNAPADMGLSRAVAASDESFYIEVPTLTPDAPPEIADGGRGATFSCPDALWHRRTPIAKLERLARTGDACGKAALAERLVEGERAPAEVFRRALRLAIEAQDANAPVYSCFLFDFARDDARFATCIERSDPSRPARNRMLALLYIAGRGVPRDLDKARAVLAKEVSQDCGTGVLGALIDEERQRPTTKRYAYCRDGACTTLDWLTCEEERRARNYWKSSELRDRLAQAAGPHRAELERLETTFLAFVKEDSLQVYWHIDGTLRNSVSAGNELDWNQRFDALLEKVLVQRSLAGASDGDIQALRERIRALDQRLLSEKPHSDAYAASSFVKSYRAAQRKYLALEHAFVAFAVRVLGPEKAPTARAALLVLRAETLERWSTT